jgi:hypothetical protein
MIQDGWYEPNMTDLKGRPLAQNPPAVQTTQFWTKGTYNQATGDQRIQVQQGLGYLLRNLVFINYPAASLTRDATSDADFPDPATIQFEANDMVTRPLALWQHLIAQQYDYTAANEAAKGRDFSVYPFPFMLDFGLMPGAETRRGYLPTSDASRLEFRGSFGAATNFTVLANYVAPANADDASITV